MGGALLITTLFQFEVPILASWRAPELTKLAFRKVKGPAAETLAIKYIVHIHTYGSFYFVCRTLRKLTGKLVKNEFFNRVLAPGTYLDRFLFKNRAESTIQISISIFLDPIHPRFAAFLDFHAFPRPKFPPACCRRFFYEKLRFVAVRRPQAPFFVSNLQSRLCHKDISSRSRVFLQNPSK